MFKNCVFKPSVNTALWFKNTVIRMIRTFAMTVVSCCPTTAAALGAVDWELAFSCAATSAIVCFFVCLTGIPEVESEE